MQRLAFAVATLLLANLLAETVRALWLSGLIPLANLWLVAFIALGLVAADLVCHTRSLTALV